MDSRPCTLPSCFDTPRNHKKTRDMYIAVHCHTSPHHFGILNHSDVFCHPNMRSGKNDDWHILILIFRVKQSSLLPTCIYIPSSNWFIHTASCLVQLPFLSLAHRVATYWGTLRHTHIYIHICFLNYSCVLLCVCIYISICISIMWYIYIYFYMYIYNVIYIYIYT